MIKKLQAEDIVQILNDEKFPSSRLFNHDKGLWVQFLMQSLNNENRFIIGRCSNGKLQNFAVVLHHNGLVSLLYISDDVLIDPEYKEAIYKWYSEFDVSVELKNLKTLDGF